MINLQDTVYQTLIGNNIKRDFNSTDDFVALEEIKPQDSSVSTTSIAAAALGLVELADTSLFNRQLQWMMNSNFPMKLMNALNNPEYTDIILWTVDGKSFSVNDSSDFVDSVLCSHFKVNTYAGFIRKLHRWGFKMIVKGINCGCFYNELFQRGRPELCKKVTRRNVKALSCFSRNSNHNEFNMEKKLLNRSTSLPHEELNFHHNVAATTAVNDIQLRQASKLNNIAFPVRGDDTQFQTTFSDLPSDYLSRRIRSSSRHKKIIGDALHSLIIESARQKLFSLELYTLKNNNEARTMGSTRSEIPTSVNESFECYGF